VSDFFGAVWKAIFQTPSGFFPLITICQTVSDKFVEVETPDKPDAFAGGLAVKNRDQIGWRDLRKAARAIPRRTRLAPSHRAKFLLFSALQSSNEFVQPPKSSRSQIVTLNF
jgi:hypothetical protein